MPPQLNDVDMKILDILRKDARKSFTDIAKQLKLSEGAVRRRVRSLTQRGVIKSFTIEVERGYQLRAFTMISVDPATPTPKVADNLIRLNGVETVYEVTGESDAIVLISAQTMPELNRCIEAIRNTPGVRDTNTTIILRSVRAERG